MMSHILVYETVTRDERSCYDGKVPTIYRILFFTLCIIIGFRLSFFYLFPSLIKNGQEVIFQTTLTEDPVVKNARQTFHAFVGDMWRSRDVVVVTKENPAFQYGQTLVISGRVEEKLLKDKQLVYAIYFPDIKAKNIGILPIFARIRQDIKKFCEKTFSQPYASLLLGILLGIKGSFSPMETISFRITGLTHVIAASGMNVTLVGGFLVGLLGIFVKRQYALLGSVGGIVAYVCLSGFQPSIVRAGVMGSLAFLGQLFGRQYSGTYTLCLVGMGMLLWDPSLLVNVGFQLSFLATGGILLTKPLIPLKGIFLDDIATTLSAQIATLPIMLATFGSYGVLSLLVNILVLWTIPIVMVMGGVGVMVGFIFRPLGHFIVWLAFPFLWYFQAVVDFFAQFGWQVTIDNWPVFLTIGWYLLLGGWIIMAKKVKQE